MITPARADITALRTQAFVITIELAGIDLTIPGSDIIAQVRLKPGSPGAPLIDFRLSGGDTEIVVTLLAMEGGIPVSTVRIKATEQVIENLPPPEETGSDTNLAWDLQVKAGDATEGIYQTLIRGAFIIQEGVTDRG